MSRLVRSTIAVALFAATACSTPRRGVRPSAVTAIRSAASTVSVRNRQWIDLRIYVITTSGVTHRLGIVPRLGSGLFALPSSIDLPANLTFLAIPLGTDDPLIVGPIEVDLGNRVLFTVETAESRSSVVKRP